MKLNQIINLHKGLTAFVVIVLMIIQYILIIMMMVMCQKMIGALVQKNC